MGDDDFTQSAELAKILEKNLGVQLGLICAAGFLVCAVSIKLVLPYAARLAVALPNARSSHKVPTPQSGGLFVIGALLFCGLVTALIDPGLRMEIAQTMTATVSLGLIGWLDDRRGLPIWFRLVAYAGVCLAYVFSQEMSFGILSVPWLERLLAAFFLLALINVTNFMDGIDGMVVAEFVPMFVLFSVFAALGLIAGYSAYIPPMLAGTLLGFFVFNRPRAQIFLGDSGSISIGFLAGIILLEVGRQHSLVFAITLPLYFFIDAGLTLAHRLFRGEHIWISHREHFYQRAYDAGQSNWSIILRVALCNITLAGLALWGAQFGNLDGIFIFATSLAIVTLLILTLARTTRLSTEVPRDAL